MNQYLFLLSISMFLFAGFAQHKVSSTIRNNHKRLSGTQYTGREAAELILSNNGLNSKVQKVQGVLTDHYSPLTKVVSLSDEIYSNQTISAIAVAAHEVGHALQDQQKYPFLVLRTTLYPVVNFSGKVFPLLLIAAVFFSLTNLAYLAIIFYSVSVFFALVTLPVEFDASSRALKEIQKYGLVSNSELSDVKKVLNAAAMTYVAAALISIVELLRYIQYFRSR